MNKPIYEDKNWKIVNVQGGLYVLLPSNGVIPKYWDFLGGGYAICLPANRKAHALAEKILNKLTK